MADGRITIDIDIPVDKVKTDAQLIDQILNSVGRDAGKELDSSFEESTDKVKQKADETSKDVDEKLSKPVDIKANLDNKDVQEKTNQTKRNLDSVPKETKTEQKADNKDAVEKARQAKEEIDKVPDRKNSKLDSTDNTKKATDSASRNADNAGKHFSKLHEIIKGTFIGNFAANAAQTALGTIKNAIGGVITEGTHYNRLQQDMLAQWNTLTGSAGKGKELVKETNDLAIAAQNSVEMVNDLNQKFYAVTNSSSKTRDLSKAVLTLQDAFGQSDDAVKNFAMQWSQMIGNGKANAQDMMSIQNVFPKFMEELVEYERKVTHNSKLTTAQVRDMMSNGKISADAMNTVLIGMGKKYKNATDNFSQTMDGMERTIHARIPVLAGAIVKPFQDLKNPLLGKMSNWITSIGAEKSFENFGKSIARIMNGVMTVINTFAMSFRANIAGAFQGSHLSDIGNSFRDIGKAVTPALQAIAGFVGVISADIFKVFTTQISGIVNGFKNVGKQKSSLNFSGVTKAFQSLSQAINAVYSYLIPLNKRIGEFVGIFAKGAIAGIVTVFQDISGAIGKVTSKITELIPPVQNTDKAVDGVTKYRAGIEKLGKVFGGLIAVILTGKATFSVLNGMKSGIESLGKAISAIKNAPGIIAKISKAFPALGKAFGALKAVFMANPFMATVAVIAALGLAFYEAYKHIKPFREWVNKAADTVHKSFDGMVRNIQAFNKSFVNGLKVVIDWVKKNWPTLLRMLVDPIGGGLKLLYDNNPKFKKWVDDLGKNISNGWSSIKKNTSKFFTDLPKNISKGMKAAIDWINKWDKAWKNNKKALADSFSNMQSNINKWGTNTHKWYDKFNKQFKKKWDNGWKNNKQALIDSFDRMKQNTSNWGSNIHKWYDNFNKNFSKNWNRGWSDTRKNLSTAWSKMQDRTSRFGSDMQNWLNNFGPNFKAGWKSLSKGVQNIFGDMWTAMKKLGKDAMGGLIDIVNGGISGINTVIYAFGGKGDTIKKIPKKFASGTGAFSGPRRAITEPTLAMVNDGFDSPETGNKEALFRPSTGEFGVFQGRNTTTMLMPGDEILNASETAMVMQGMGITHFAKGTGWLGNITNSVGSFFGGIGSWVKDKVDDLKKYFDLAKKIISNPTQYVESIFNFKGFNSGQRSMKALANGLFDQANKNVQSFWKTLWNMVSGQFNGGAANSDLLAAAQKYGSGHPYVWGSKGADAFDCSGLVQYAVEHAFHKSFPAGSSAQYAATQSVDNPQPGDLVFFGAGGANHVGIYAGGDNYYSAQSPSASPNIGMGKISAVHEGPVSYRRIPGINALGKSGDNVKANSGLEKWIKKTIAPGFWKFIDKLNSLFNVSIGSGGPNSAPTGDHKHWLKQAGIPESWFNGLNSIIQQESGWRVNATNPSSGAYGIPQSLPGNKMASAGSDWRTNPITQLKWMYSYIKGRYGSLQNALSFRAANGWYGNGGEFDSPKVIGVGEDGPEFVINPQKSTADHLIDKAILQRAKVAPESPTASLARIMEQVKYSSVAGYGTSDSSTVAGQNIVKVNNQGQAIDGNTVIKFIVSDKEMARTIYPTIKMLQAHDITIKQQGGAVPVV